MASLARPRGALPLQRGYSLTLACVAERSAAARSPPDFCLFAKADPFAVRLAVGCLA